MPSKLALLICATSLVVAVSASAQNRDGDRPDRPRREEGGARPASAPAQNPPARTPSPSHTSAPTPPPSASGPRYGSEGRSWQGSGSATPTQRQAPPTSQPPAPASSARANGDRGDWSRSDRNGGDRSVADRRGGDRSEPDRRRGDRDEADRRGGDRGWGDGGRWDRDERDRRGNGDRGWSYRGEDHARFRAPPYRYPYNWGYRSWRVGERLPYLFLSDGYYVDFEPYGLPRPPYGYRWVRFGPDVLLVNVYTGEIVDVVYDIFY